MILRMVLRCWSKRVVEFNTLDVGPFSFGVESKRISYALGLSLETSVSSFSCWDGGERRDCATDGVSL